MFQIFKIKGKSMEPSYREGNIVMIRKTKNIKTNDVIVFKKEGLTMIKRVEGMKTKKIAETAINFQERKKYSVQGDNQKESDGSQEFGEVEEERIIGKVIVKLF